MVVIMLVIVTVDQVRWGFTVGVTVAIVDVRVDSWTTVEVDDDHGSPRNEDASDAVDLPELGAIRGRPEVGQDVVVDWFRARATNSNQCDPGLMAKTMPSKQCGVGIICLQKNHRGLVVSITTVISLLPRTW